MIRLYILVPALISYLSLPQATQTQTRMFLDASTKGDPGFVALRIEGPLNNIEIAKEHVRLFLEKEAKEKKKVESKPVKLKSSIEQDQKKQPLPTPRKIIMKKDEKKNIEPPSKHLQKPSTFAAAVSRSIGTTSAVKEPVDKNTAQSKKLKPKEDIDFAAGKVDKPGAPEGRSLVEKSGGSLNRRVSELSLSPSEEISALVPNKTGVSNVVEDVTASKAPVFEDSRVFTPITVPQSISVLTEPEEVSAVSQPVRASPSSVTNELPLHTPPGFKSKRSRAKGNAEDLLVFLQKTSACIKASPEDFHQYLIESDVKCVSDLNDACKDKFFLPLMRNEWLKGFKVNSFIAAVADAAEHPPVFKVSSSFTPAIADGSDHPAAPSAILPDDFGFLNAPLTNQSAIAMQQLNFASNMGSDLPLAPTETETASGNQPVGENDSQLLWANWN